MFPLAVLSILATAVSAATVTDIAAVEAHFQNSGLNTVFTTFKPQAVLDASFGSSEVAIGQPVTAETAGTRPELTVDGADGFDPSGKYSLLLVDTNIAGTDPASNDGKAQNLHWLTNNVGLTGTRNSTVDYTGETVIRAYAGPGPAEGSGAHRYVLILYRQPADFVAPEGFAATINEVPAFNLNDYVGAAKLELVAANYFTVENGVATVTASVTYPVDSKTLPLPSTSVPANSSATSAASTASASVPASSSPVSASLTGSRSATAPATTSSNSAAGKAIPAFAALVAGAIAAFL